MHLVQGFLQAVFLAGIDTDGLQGFQLGCNALLKKVLHREGIPNALLSLLDGTLVVLKAMWMFQASLEKQLQDLPDSADPNGRHR